MLKGWHIAAIPDFQGGSCLKIYFIIKKTGRLRAGIKRDPFAPKARCEKCNAGRKLFFHDLEVK
jgi:hypothetical protein|tara:strand:- start:34094 stop:34285 length:192 start_codon:yes stop_codon:yes gene_type:complete